MQRYRQKISKKTNIQWTPHRYRQDDRALSLLYHYGALTSCKKLEKTNEWSPRYSKTDNGQTEWQEWLHRIPSDKAGSKKLKNDSQKSQKIRCLVSIIQLESDFSLTCGVRQVIDNVEFIMYMKLKTILRTGGRYIGKKTLKIPPKWVFPNCDTHKIFFSKIRLYYLCTLIVT